MYSGMRTEPGQPVVQGRVVTATEPKIEWWRLSPVKAGQRVPPLRRQGKVFSGVR